MLVLIVETRGGIILFTIIKMEILTKQRSANRNYLKYLFSNTNNTIDNIFLSCDNFLAGSELYYLLFFICVKNTFPLLFSIKLRIIYNLNNSLLIKFFEIKK